MKKLICMLTLASVGLVSLAQVADSTKVGDIDRTISLEDVVVKGVAPKTKLRGDAMVTKIQGSVLENSGSLYEMLGKVPGMMQRGEDLEVIGKGTPIYYINGRKIYDIAELKRMRSEDILEVEVINNPGSQYDATVRSVVKIRTRRPQGEGFGFDVSASHSQDLRQADFADPTATLNLNYRNKGFDIFGMVNHWSQHSRQTYDADQHIFTTDNENINDNWHVADGSVKTSNHGMNFAVGTNWMINERHSMGFRLNLDKLLFSRSPSVINDEIYNNGVLYQRITTETLTNSSMPLGYNLNTYYNGNVGKMNIDWNFDWNRKGVTEEMDGENGKVKSISNSSSNLFATKFVLSHPVWKGMLNVGTEMTWVKREIDYTINRDYIANSRSDTHENSYSFFVEYSANFGKCGMAKVGARYEHVVFNYDNLINPKESVHDVRRGFYPSLSYSVTVGMVSLSLSYATKVVRPNFFFLNDATSYASHSILMQGNAQLRNQTKHELGLNARWRWLTGAVSFTQDNDMISQWGYPYIDDKITAQEGVIVYKRINLTEPVRTLVTCINASPTFGCYTMNWTFGCQKQFLTLMLDDAREATGKREKSYNEPQFFLSANNTVRLPHGWQMECNLSTYTPGNVNNFRLNRWSTKLSAAIQKTMLHDKALTMRLSANDILYSSSEYIFMDGGNCQVLQRNWYSTQRLNLSVRYMFNAAKSKYKGTGAGQDVKDRMKQ